MASHLSSLVLTILMSVALAYGQQMSLAGKDTIPALKYSLSTYFEFGFADWAVHPKDVSSSLQGSSHFGVDIIFQKQLGSSRLYWGTGVSLWDMVVSNDAHPISTPQGSTTLQPLPETPPYDVNTLNTSFVGIPFLLNYQLPLNNVKDVLLAFSGGFKIGYRTSGSYATERGDTVLTIRHVPNASWWQYGVLGRVEVFSLSAAHPQGQTHSGWSFNLFGYHALNNLFVAGKGPGVRPYAFGLGFCFFWGS